jgi:superfamily II DNA or RNA helicase
VHKDFLGKQWYNRFQKFSNARVGFLGGKKPVLTEADVARMARSKRSRGGSKRDKWEVLADDNDVVVATVQTLCKGTKVPQSFYDKFGMVVIDECHHMAARSFSRALSEIYTGYMLGLSATPRRKDGLADVFHWWMGPTLHYEPPKPNPRVRVNRYRFRCAHEDFKEQRSWMGGGRTGPDQVKTISKLIGLRERNSFIVDRIWDRLLTPGARILVLSERLAHLKSMRKELRRRDDAVRAALRRTADAMERSSPGSGEHLYASAEKRLKLTKMVGGMKADAMKAAEEGTVIFSTFALSEEGLDVESLNTVVLTTTKTTILQSVGRILRAMDYAEGLEPLVIDMVDQIPLISRQALKRMEEYQICKYNITDFDEHCNIISARSQDVKKFISNDDIMAIETDDDEGDNAELCCGE